jgi:hypothetical protein
MRFLRQVFLERTLVADELTSFVYATGDASYVESLLWAAEFKDRA